jgi:hypothetical protein
MMIDWNNFTPWTSLAGGLKAIASLAFDGIKPGLFVLGMLASMAAFELPERTKSRSRHRQPNQKT